jgi:predicted aconitase with swiveling domain
MNLDGPEMSTLISRVLIEGQAEGPVLKLDADISLWGGVDPQTGTIIDARHPQYRQSIAGKILAMNRSIGSSSGSSILLELLQRGCGPLGIILIEVDFIVTLGVVVAREMKFGDIPVVQVARVDLPLLPGAARINPDGRIDDLGSS